MSIWFTIYKAMLSCKYMSALSYRYIHLIIFIFSYFNFINSKYVNLLFFVNNHHKTLFISKCLKQLLCGILLHNYLLQKSTSTTSQNCRSPAQSKYFKTGIYQSSDNCCEGYHNYDINCLVSVILRQYNTVTNRC